VSGDHLVKKVRVLEASYFSIILVLCHFSATHTPTPTRPVVSPVALFLAFMSRKYSHNREREREQYLLSFIDKKILPRTNFMDPFSSLRIMEYLKIFSLGYL
jgi:hypothetical protein